MEPRHSVTIDLPDPLYRTASQLAADRGISLPAFAREAIIEKARSLPEVDLSMAYDLLADDAEETDVEVFFQAQADILEE